MEAFRERFWASTRREGECLIWIGDVSHGHARFHVLKPERDQLGGKKDVSAHLVAWWLTHGSWSKFVDRTCGNTLCVAPSHLEVRTSESRFWRSVDKTSTPEGCWPWTGAKHTFGYGSSARGVAHRAAYRLTYGEIPEGAVVRHTCHNPVCCRPGHLIPGTQKDNVHDMIKAGRAHYVRGEKIPLAKLTDAQACVLREIYPDVLRNRHQNEAVGRLARLLDVSPRLVWRVVKGISYTTPSATTPRRSPRRDPVWGALPEEEKQAKVGQIVAQLHAVGFPWSVLVTGDEDPTGRVRRGKVTLHGGQVIRGVSSAGQRACLAAHRHRFEANHGGQLSVVDAFHDVALLGKAVRYQLDRGDPVTPSHVVQAISAFVRAPRNFPPVLARWLVDHYAPHGGHVFDPCAGYGGRLLGALASTQEVTYTGFDIEAQTVEGNLNLAATLQQESRVRSAQHAVEDDVHWPQADLVLTGPPYFNQENYGPAAQAQMCAHAGYSSWCDGFLRVLVCKTLQVAPTVVINVAAIPAGDIPRDVARIAKEARASVDRVISWPRRVFGKARGGAEEKILVLRK